MCEGNVMMARLTRKDLLYLFSTQGDIVSTTHISPALVLLVWLGVCLNFSSALVLLVWLGVCLNFICLDLLLVAKARQILLVVIIFLELFCSYSDRQDDIVIC